VLASVAYAAGIINAQFYTTLILVAVITSQAADAWLEHVLRKGKPLLTEEPEDRAREESGDRVIGSSGEVKTLAA